MLPNLAVLEKKCVALGLTPTPKGKRLGKQDCVDVLRAHFLPEGGIPYEELTPMLAFAEWNLKEEEQTKIWNSPSWVAQKKLNGCRVILHFVKDVGVFAHSRTVSLKTYRFQELTNQFLFHDFIPDFTATVDAEAIIEKPVDTRPYTTKGEITKTSLHSTTSVLHLEAENARKLQREQDAPLILQVFDITKMESKTGVADLCQLKLMARLTWLTNFMHKIESTEIAHFFQFPEVEQTDKRAFYKKIIAEGGEGVILKSLNAPYVDSSSRRRDAWVKVKRRMEFDAYVVDFKRGEEGTGWENLIGALGFAVNTENGPHTIAWCTNLPLETRKKITRYNSETNEVSLHPGMYNKVAEVSGQDISARSLRLSHATIDRWRPKDGPDAKRPEECNTELADLKEASAWVG